MCHSEKQYQYVLVTSSNEGDRGLMTKLNALGAQGWRLIEASYRRNSITGTSVMMEKVI